MEARALFRIETQHNRVDQEFITSGFKKTKTTTIEDRLSQGNTDVLLQVPSLVGCAVSTAKMNGCHDKTNNSVIVGATQIFRHLSISCDF